VLRLQLGFVVLRRWLADHGQVTERSALWYRLSGQKGAAVGRLSVQHGLFRVFAGQVALPGTRSFFPVLATNAGRAARQQVRQIAERQRRRILVERRPEFAFLDGRHQVEHEVVTELHLGDRLVACQQFVHPTVHVVFVCRRCENDYYVSPAVNGGNTYYIIGKY